jgi:hypothetical protein
MISKLPKNKNCTLAVSSGKRGMLRRLQVLDPRLASWLPCLILTGCWTPPVADVQPKGDARLIQQAIKVVAVKEDATVESIDADRGVIALKFADGLAATIKPPPGVADFSKIRAGDKGRARVAQELSVYVLIDGRLPGDDGKPKAVRTDAKVLQIDTAYRLLTLQYPNRQVEIFKVGLDAKLSAMEAGDSVTIETTELLALKVKKP